MVEYRVCMHTIYSQLESYDETCKWMNTAYVTIVYQYIYIYISILFPVKHFPRGENKSM